MPERAGRATRSKRAFLACLLACTVALALGTSSAEAAKQTLRPVSVGKHALVFQVERLQPASILGASTRLHLKRARVHRMLRHRFGGRPVARRHARARMHRRLHRRLRIANVRRAAATDSNLRVGKPAWTGRGRLKVKIESQTDPSPPMDWPPVTWNVFSDQSPWNQQLSHASVDVQSDVMIRNLVADGPPAVSNPTVRQNWGTPIYFGAADDPLYRLSISGRQDYAREINDMSIHVPPNARPSAAHDGVIWIADETDGYVYMLQQAVVDGSAHTISAWKGYRLSSEGLGFRHLDGPPTGVQPIRPEELAAGYVNHAMSMEVRCLSGHPVAPFDRSLTIGHTCGDGGGGRLSMGNVVFLDMSHSQIDDLGLPKWEDAILKGLADYGAVVGLNGGAGHWALKFENPLDRTTQGQADPYAAAGLPSTLDFSHALDGVGGWQAHLKVMQPFARPCSGICD